jgi:hypothetical protein
MEAEAARRVMRSVVHRSTEDGEDEPWTRAGEPRGRVVAG